MSAILYEQSRQLEKAIGSIEGEYSLVKSAMGLVLPLVYLVMTGSLVVLLVAAWGMSRTIKTAPDGVVIDDDDRLADDLLGILEKIKWIHQGMGEMLSRHQLPFLLPFFLRIWQALLRKVHAKISSIRIFMLEHDAGCSELSGDGPFNDADDLIRSLRA